VKIEGVFHQKEAASFDLSFISLFSSIYPVGKCFSFVPCFVFHQTFIFCQPDIYIYILTEV